MRHSDEAKPERKPYRRHTARQRARLIKRAVARRSDPRRPGVRCPTWAAIAKELGITTRTLERWKQTEEWAELRAAHRRRATAALRAAWGGDPARQRAAALAHVRGLMRHSYSEYVRLAAAKDLIGAAAAERAAGAAATDDGAAAWIATATELNERRSGGTG
jgi:hypothetical protein